MRCDLEFATQPRDELQVVVAEREPNELPAILRCANSAESSRASRGSQSRIWSSCRRRYCVTGCSGTGNTSSVASATSGGALDGFRDRVRVAIDVEEAEARDVHHVADAVGEPAADFLQTPRRPKLPIPMRTVGRITPALFAGR